MPDTLGAGAEDKHMKHIYIFHEDKPNGGMIVECGACEKLFDLPNPIEAGFKLEHTCPHCEAVVNYPEGASW